MLDSVSDCWLHGVLCLVEEPSCLENFSYLFGVELVFREKQ